jgi:hypothetical protein
VGARQGRHDSPGRAHSASSADLRKLLSDKIELTPVGAGRRRGYQFRGALTIDRLIGGEALQTSLSMVAPTGFEPLCGAPGARRRLEAGRLAPAPLVDAVTPRRAISKSS